MKDKDEKR